MRAVLQKVSLASVSVDGEMIGEVGKGMLILLGVSREDSKKDADYLLEKSVNLRIFEDEQDKMNLSLLDVDGEMLVVSQFTLYGDARKGRRPSFIKAALPDEANSLYEYFVAQAKTKVEKVETGKFQAMMNVELVNDGPVTILLDSNKNF